LVLKGIPTHCGLLKNIGEFAGTMALFFITLKSVSEKKPGK
jgi:hypothetical protein